MNHGTATWDVKEFGEYETEIFKSRSYQPMFISRFPVILKFPEGACHLRLIESYSPQTEAFSSQLPFPIDL